MKFFKKAFLLSLVLIALVVTLASCSKKKVTLSAEKNEISVIIGENVDLKLSATEVKKFTEQDILSNLDITSSDNKIVKVEADKITAVGIGTANVTATWKEYDGATVTVKVNVIAPEVGEVTYSTLPSNIYVGDKVSITHTAGSDVTVTYATSNEDVLSVDGNNFEALTKGTAKITATATNGYKESKKEWNVEVLQGEYVITYVLNGGTNAEANPSKYDVRELPLIIAAATKAHKTFLGWTKEAGSTDYVTEISAEEIGNVTLYANYEDIIHNITYVLNGGTNPTNAPLTYVEGVGCELPVPTKKDYNFLGWTVKLTSTSYITEIGKEATSDYKVYAQWEKIVVYSNIVYELNGGTNPSDAKKEYEEGVGYQLPTPTRTNYKFLGWTKEAESTSYITEIGKDATGEFKVYAQWEKQIVKSAITYNLDGGLLPEGYVTEYLEGEIVVLPVPTKEGFDFLGWSSVQGGTSYITEVPATATGEFVVYANWKEKLVLLEGYKYVGEGLHFATLDEAVSSVADGDKIMLPAGEYSLGVVIDKSIEIHGPNANLQPTSFKSGEAVINVAKDVAGNIAAKNVVFNGVHLKGTGGGGGIPYLRCGRLDTLSHRSALRKPRGV